MPNRLDRILLFSSLLIFLSIPLFSQDIKADWGVVFSSPSSDFNSLKISEIENAVLPDIFTAGIPGSSLSGGGQCLWLVSSLKVPSSLTGEDLVVSFDEVPSAVEFYINGNKIGKIGNTGSKYFMHSGSHVRFALTPELLSEDENIIALKVFNDSAEFKIQQPMIGLYDDNINRIRILSFLNGQIFFGFSVLVLFIGLYYLSLFMFNRNEKINLFFALANIFLFIYFAQMGLPFRVFAYQPFLVIGKYSLFLYFTFLSLFFVIFFNVFNKRLFKIALGAVAVVIGLVYLRNSGTVSEVSKAFDIALIPGGLELLMMLGIAAFSMIKKNADAVPVFIGVMIGLGSAGYDFYFALSGHEPAFWLQGFGILIFNICMFEMLSLRAIKADRLLKKSSEKIRENARIMKEFLEKVETVSLSVAEMSTSLDLEIEASSSSVGELVRGADVIASSSEEQLSYVNETGESLRVLLSSADSINNELDKQQLNVEETSHLVSEMLENISLITENLKKTSDFTEELGQLTVKGEEAVKRSTDTVSSIHDDSKNIYKILSSISDISAETNLLAMNAAIEAAHAGKAGAGFAVVASEIRKLAINTAGRTKETVEQIDSIVERIGEGYKANLEVKELLSQIGLSTKTAVEQVKSVYLAVDEQRAASNAVQSTVSSLREVSGSIKVQTEKQKLKSRELESKQSQLREISSRVYQSVDRMSAANTKIQTALMRVQNVSSGTNAEAVKLKALLEQG